MANNLFIFNFSMKKFLSNISIYIIFVLFMSLVIDYTLSKYLQNTHWRKYDTWTNIINSKFQENDLLIFGSSRAWVQISPAILDSVLGTNSYNLGIDGRPFRCQYLRWRLYNTFHNQKPKYIIQNIDYISTLNENDGYESEQFFPYFWNIKFTNEAFKYEHFSNAQKYIPLYRYYQNGICNILHKDEHLLHKGYQGLERKWDPVIFNSMDSIMVLCDKDTKKLFVEYATELFSSGINLIFVKTPMYIGAKNKMTSIHETDKIYEEISILYNIPILDYTFCDISNDSTLFYNVSHLNKKGAELFSYKLANDLKKYIQKEQATIIP